MRVHARAQPRKPTTLGAPQGYYLEDGVEERNVLERNLAIFVKARARAVFWDTPKGCRV